jgi:hypothetical protein
LEKPSVEMVHAEMIRAFGEERAELMLRTLASTTWFHKYLLKEIYSDINKVVDMYFVEYLPECISSHKTPDNIYYWVINEGNNSYVDSVLGLILGEDSLPDEIYDQADSWLRYRLEDLYEKRVETYKVKPSNEHNS